MTDKDIIKALKCASCIDVVRNNTLDLINRQQAEIERLKYLLDWEEKKYYLCSKRFFKEGVKEFAEYFKSQLDNPYIQRAGKEYVNFIKAIADNTYKELVGE